MTMDNDRADWSVGFLVVHDVGDSRPTRGHVKHWTKHEQFKTEQFVHYRDHCICPSLEHQETLQDMEEGVLAQAMAEAADKMPEASERKKEENREETQEDKKGDDKKERKMAEKQVKFPEEPQEV